MESNGTLKSSDILVAFGSDLKLMPNGHIGGYLVRFSTAADPDLSGDFFTKDTDFGFTDTIKSPVYFNHRLPLPTATGKDIVIKEKIGEATLKMDDVGILTDAILFNRKQYEAVLDSMGWSSGTATHLVDRKKVGHANKVLAWPLGLDASITPCPCEPRNDVVTMKTFAEMVKSLVFENTPELKTNSVTLAMRLTRKIDDLADDGQERTDIVKRMAREAMAEVSEVEDVLNGKKRRPSNAALKAFSRVLGISYDTLKIVADHQRKGTDSLKSAFDEAVAEEMSEGLCKYELDCILGRLTGDIALMAKASQTTGTAFSLDQAVGDLVAAYASYLQTSIIGQVNDWLEPGDSEIYDSNEFYLKSLIRIDPDVMRLVTKSITMDEHLLLVGTAEEDLVARFDANAKPREKSTKAGRELSDKNRQRLQKMKDAHKEHTDQMQSDMQALLDATMPKASDAEKNAVLAKHLVLRQERRQLLGV